MTASSTGSMSADAFAVDAGERPPGPQRRCIVSGVVGDRRSMVRFVVGPDGAAVPDVDGRLPGRGIWLSADRDVLNKACARKLFSRAVRSAVTVPDGLVEQVERLLVLRCQNLIGLARRAGQVVCGFVKVGASLDAHRAALVLAAVDGAEGGRAKIRARAGSVPVIEVLRGEELGAAVGRPDVVHMSIAAGRLAQTIQSETGRLAGLRFPPSGRPGLGVLRDSDPILRGR